MNLVFADDISSVIDRSKIPREQSKIRNELPEENSAEGKGFCSSTGVKTNRKKIPKYEGTSKYYSTFI